MRGQTPESDTLTDHTPQNINPEPTDQTQNHKTQPDEPPEYK